jgi:hypothetical protein
LGMHYLTAFSIVTSMRTGVNKRAL